MFQNVENESFNDEECDYNVNETSEEEEWDNDGIKTSEEEQFIIKLATIYLYFSIFCKFYLVQCILHINVIRR